MGKKQNTYAKNGKQPYTNMGARKLVLFLGFVLCIAAFAIVLVGVLSLFIPNMSLNVGDLTGLKSLTVIFACGLGLAFVGTVFALAGANTAKGIARLSFTLGLLAFIVAIAMLLITLLFKTILPIEALNRLL